MAKSINRLMAELIDDDGDVKLENLDEAPTGLDSAQVTSIAEDATMSVYDSLSLLPISSLTAGSQAFVKSNKRLYISNGSGWYNVALVNLTPTMSLDPTGSIAFDAETLSATVTITAQDSDNPDAILSYSVESDGNMAATGFSVTQDSSVFTISGISEDSGGVAGDFTLTFKTTDNINTATATKDFTLTFSNVIDSSADTIFLLKAKNAAYGNYAAQAFTFKDSADAARSWTANVGDVHADAFTPYSNDYSAHFDGTGDYIQFPANANMATNGSEDYTLEFWMYQNDTTDLCIFDNTGAGGNMQVSRISGTWYHAGGTFNPGTINNYQWYHFAIVHDATANTVKVYVDGTLQSTISGVTAAIGSASGSNTIGVRNDGYYYFHGYIKDLRFVKGSQVYTTAFTPPTEPLTAISGTSLLACNLPYLADASGNHVLRNYNDTKLRPFSPYNKEPWSANKRGMSLQFHGSNSRIQYSDTTVNPGTSDCTWEGWFYPYDNTHNGLIFDTENAGTAGIYFFYNGYNTWYLAGSDSLAIQHTRNGTTSHHWTHFAITKSGSTYELFLDGKSVGTDTGASDITGSGLSMGCRYNTNTLDAIGNVADFHVTKEVKYTADFTPPTRAVAHSAGNTLMRFAGDLIMYDASGAMTLHSQSQGGGPNISTTTRKWTGSGAFSFDGNDFIGIGNQKEHQDATETPLELYLYDKDFTIEFWIYFTTLPSANASMTILSIGYQTGGYGNIAIVDGTGGNVLLYASDNNSTWGISGVSFGVMTINTWHHIALTREGNNHRLFKDGTLTSTATTITGAYPAPTLESGIGGGGYGSLSGALMQDVRITMGRARYTAAFTPPTAEFEL